MQTTSRPHLAQQLHDLLLHEMGEHIDINLLLGPPEYARAVLSLCRTCGSAQLARLGEQFARASEDAVRTERSHQQMRLVQNNRTTPSDLQRKARHG
ncbi:MAG: hypothetical protein AB3X44_03470 [Leptothrix sp. (in: b-proteobacteria)]